MPDGSIETAQPPAAAASRSARGARGRVTIFGMWCKGCRLCVEFCPTGVLDFVDDPNQPSVVHPEKCTACHWCDTHCPDLAIVVQPIA
jgi:2-oxoglutarate ferredoxin oxidoreductase subunit delta